MTGFELVGEDAQIVLVGNLNPRIFHPEWLIRKDICREWDYKSNPNHINLPDLAQFATAEGRNVTVYLNKFEAVTTLASDFLELSDFVSSIFAHLPETPINQIGLNRSFVYKIHDADTWMQFGRVLAVKEPWLIAGDYMANLPEETQRQFGLWDMTMNYPRPDDLVGYLRARIFVKNSAEKVLCFYLNSHIEAQEQNGGYVASMLDKCWRESLTLAARMQKQLFTEVLSQISNEAQS
jgi:hypothetical protein